MVLTCNITGEKKAVQGISPEDSVFPEGRGRVFPVQPSKHFASRLWQHGDGQNNVNVLRYF